MSVDTYYWLIILLQLSLSFSHIILIKSTAILKSGDCTNPKIKRFVFCDNQHLKWTGVTAGDSAVTLVERILRNLNVSSPVDANTNTGSIVESALNYHWIDVPPWQLQDQIIRWFRNYFLYGLVWTGARALCLVCPKKKISQWKQEK